MTEKQHTVLTAITHLKTNTDSSLHHTHIWTTHTDLCEKSKPVAISHGLTIVGAIT